MEKSRMNPWMVSTLVLIGVIVGFGASQIPAITKMGIFGKAATVQQNEVNPTPTPAPTAEEQKTPLTADQIAALPDDDAVKGDINAPVTMVEFSDFECPYCRRFFEQTLPQIDENYIKTGKVKMIYRDFLIDGHNESPYAALVAQCANDQGKFWEMHDELFKGQLDWAGNEKVKSIMDGYAKKIGLDMSKFTSCVTSKKFGEEIKKDVIDGISVGVSGTPGFFINGKEISGAMPYEQVFKPALDAEIAGKQWQLQFDARGGVSVKVF